ncbi:MAG: GNAT family N-acetyltransferase [Rubrivivax sp.]
MSLFSESLESGCLEPDPVISTVTLKVSAHIVGNFRCTDPLSIQAHGHQLENSPVACEAFVVRDAPQHMLACGLMAIGGDLVGLYDVFTAPESRDQGVSRRLCDQSLQRAAARGARLAYLQVVAGNHAARAVYTRLGFRDAYDYHTGR